MARVKNPILLRETAAPSTPAAGNVALYSVDGSVLLMKDDAGVVTTFRQPNVQKGSVATQVTGAVDVYVTNSNLAVPVPAKMQAGMKAKWELSITKAAAGTGTPVFTVRYGTAGAIGDTSRVVFTWPAANTAVADEMQVEIMLTFRAVGSGTTAVLEGSLIAQHELTTTGFGGTALGSIIIVNAVSAGFDSTPANSFIGLSVNPGTAGAWSIRQCQGNIEGNL